MFDNFQSLNSIFIVDLYFMVNWHQLKVIQYYFAQGLKLLAGIR